MAKKNTRRNATAAATATPTGGTPGTGTWVAPDRQTSAVWDALEANPGASVASIAAAAGAAEHKVRRALAMLEVAGRVRRTTGRRAGGKRIPDAWYPATPASGEPAAESASDVEATTPADRGEATSAADAPAALDPATAATVEEPEAATDEAAPEAAGDGVDAVAVADARDALSGLGAAISTALEALEAGQGAVALSAGEEIVRSSGRVGRLVRTAVHGPARCASGRVKARPRELQAKVAAHLNAYPGKEFTPHEVAKVIGHSAGAISNALDRLVALGTATCTCERPRRFSAAPDVRAVEAASGRSAAE